MFVRSFAGRAILVVAVLVVGTFQTAGQTQSALSRQRDAAFALEQQGDASGAEAAWRAILKANPGDAEALAHLGFLESQQQHYDEAVLFYRRALALNPSIPGLQMNLGLALFKAGDLREAGRVLAPLLHAAAPDSPEAQRLRLLVGMADYGSGQYAAAVPYLREAMARDPQNLPYRLVLAHSCLWTKQYQCVLDVYHQILTLNAESAEADMLAGEAYDEMRDHEDAIQQFRNAVKADPKEPGVHFGLGYLLWCQSKFDEAAQQFELENKNNPNDAESIAYWADSEVRLEQPDAARPLLRKALEMNQHEELPWLDLGIIDAGAGHNAEALREFRTAERMDPSDVQVHWRLARLYQSMGNKAAARAEFDVTKKLNKQADESVFQKLHPTQASGNSGAPAKEKLSGQP